MTITDIINRFNTTPFLFVGSGITRRYFNLPDWRGLLKHFAQEIRKDTFAYSVYENRAKVLECPAGIMPKIAELIQRDYDEKWFEDEVERSVEADVMEQIREGLSPFKAEIAQYIKRNSTINSFYQAEINKLSEISEKSIAGVITTNYDTFLEDCFSGFKKYVGQSQLIFSAINILKSIVNCLDSEQIKQLENRFVFVEYKQGMTGNEITPYMIMIDGKPFIMSKITLSDFMPLYIAIGSKRAKLPVRILRKFKQELYSYVITNTPTATLRVAAIEDDRVADEELVLAVGRAEQLGVRGLSGINGNDWYRNVVIGDLLFTADELLEHAYPVLIKQNSNRLPLNKYLSLATGKYPECEEMARKLTLEEIIPDTLQRNRGSGEYHSVLEIWQNEGTKIERMTRLISQLNEDELKVAELEKVLKHIFEDKDVLEHISNTDRSQIRRLILIYDCLKWGKCKRAS